MNNGHGAVASPKKCITLNVEYKIFLSIITIYVHIY